MANRKTKFDFEESLQRLEELVESMEEGELTLEESLKAFEQGIKLTRECQEALDKAEQKIEILTRENELPETESFDESLEEDQDED